MTDAHDRTGQDEYQLAAVRAAGDAIVSKASDGVVTSWNPAAERIFGWSAAEAVGCHVSFLIPPDRLDEWTGLMDRVRGGERIEQFETVRVRKDGARIDVAVTIAPIYDRDGRLVGISKVARDVTEHRRLVAERDEAHRQLLLQIERMPLAYVLCAPDLRCVRWNPAAERLFGYPADEMLGRNPFDVLTPPQSRGLVADTLRRLRAGDMDAHGVWDVVTRDRRTATCEWHNTPLTGDDGAFRGVFSLAEDLTERRSLEDRYRHAQKMEAVGQLAGGVAHDFNNLLTVINGYADLLLRDLSPGDPRRGLVEEIHGAGVRSASLTRQLLAFSRKQVVAPRPLDLNAVVADTQKLLARVIGEDVRLHLSLDPGLGTVEADPGQVEQVLLNLAINARDAMPTGGQLTIETRDVELDGAPVRAEVRPGRHALLAVSDTGCGMTPEV
ncbi:MAG: PAS domain S-box protein, partial [Planctomycetes bacterium]|nr:PAS domain S-box protein [Planctomycetota bacterium]